MIDFIQTSRRSSILLGERHTTVFNRFAAKAIDLVILAAIYFIVKAFWFPLGGVAAALYAAVQDSFGMGQSVGKKIIGLRVIEDQSGLACSSYHSLLRNAPLVILLLFSQVPVLWAFTLFLTAPVLILEIYLVQMVDVGVRLGDVMGNTLVIEYMEERIISAN